MPKLPVPPGPVRPFRILSLPLARLAPKKSSTNAKPATPLLLFQVLQPDVTEKGPPPIYNRALDKASEQWLKLGSKPKDSWMYYFWKRGEGLMDKIEFEEWMLKGVVEGKGVKIVKEGQEGVQQKIEIPLLQPTLKDLPLPSLLPKLHRLLIHRVPYHRKMMIRSLLATPLTAPFALIPVMPNFPFFYVLWRAWSHYKAWRGAVYLEDLLKLGMIVEKPSAELTTVYETKGVAVGEDGSENIAPDSTVSTGGTAVTEAEELPPAPETKEKAGEGLVEQAKGRGAAPDGTATPASLIYEKGTVGESSGSAKAELRTRHPSLLLDASQIPLLRKTFGLKSNEVVDVVRAVEQADLRAWAVEDKEKAQAGEKKE
ncbi:hypothetical protein P7C73_g6005, partial [Tremellales sp. Uapishka_1]